MSSPIDIPRLIQASKTDFSMGIHVDVSKVHDLFQSLCFAVRGLERELIELRAQLKDKADMDALTRVSNSLERNAEVAQELSDNVDDLRKDLQASRQDFDNVRRSFADSNTRPIPHSTASESDSPTPDVAQPDEESQPAVHISGQLFPREKPPQPLRGSLSTSDAVLPSADLSGSLEKLNRRIAKCEGKFPEIQAQFEKFTAGLSAQKSALDDHKAAMAARRSAELDTRRQRFAEFANELTAPPPTVASKEAEPLSSPKSTDSPVETVPSPTEERREESRPPPSAPQPPRETAADFNAEEFLENVLDAARRDIAVTKNDVLATSREELALVQTHLASGMAKMAAGSDIATRKVAGELHDLNARVATNIIDLQTQTGTLARQFSQDFGAIQSKNQALEERLNQMSQSDGRDFLKKVLNDQGKVDVPLLLDQIRALMALSNDLATRLRHIEKEDFVSVSRFDPFATKVEELEARAATSAVALEGANSKIGDLQESVSRIKNIENEQTSIQQKMDQFIQLLNQVKEAAARNDDEVTRCKKSVVAVRAAIATLRGHSEETRALADEAQRAVHRSRDEIGIVDAQVKRVLTFVQSELIENGSQMKDLQHMVERSDERIDAVNRSVVQLQTARPVAPVPVVAHVEAPAPEEKPEAEARPSTPPPPVQTTQESKPEPPPPPEQDADEQPATVITLPEKIVYEQPIVTIVRRRQIEVVENVTSKLPLPRLGGTAGRRENEVTRNDLHRFEGLIPRVQDSEEALAAIRAQLDGLARAVTGLANTKADKSELQTLFEHFRNALAEVSGRVMSLRGVVLQKADAGELQEVQLQIQRRVQETSETAAGTETLRCLVCGKSQSTVKGAIDDPVAMRALGPPPSTRVTSPDGHGNACFVYGDHGALFWGRSADGKPLVVKGKDPTTPGTALPPISARGGRKVVTSVL